MPFIKTMKPDAGPPAVYAAYPDVYRPWSEMSQAMMNGPSPLSRGERELIFAYASGLAGCEFTYVAHSEVAYAFGIPQGSIASLIADPASTAIDEGLTPLLAFVRKLTLEPGDIGQEDVDAVFAAGFEQQAFDDAVAITGRAMFMRCIAQAHGFTPMTREKAAARAHQRIEHGYINLYPSFRDKH
ncbi:hypothetical protein NRB_06880 [Novosphingobium sp. 11B]